MDFIDLHSFLETDEAYWLREIADIRRVIAAIGLAADTVIAAAAVAQAAAVRSGYSGRGKWADLGWRGGLFSAAADNVLAGAVIAVAG